MKLQRSELTMIAVVVINLPLILLGVVILFREISLATLTAFLITTIGPLCTICFVQKKRKKAKKTKGYYATSLAYNFVLILSILGSYIVYGFKSESILLLPLIIIAVINILIVWQFHIFIPEALSET